MDSGSSLGFHDAALLVVEVSLRSPLGKVLGSGSAKEGTSHWWAQRVTAVALLLLGGWFLLALSPQTALDSIAVRHWIALPWNSVLLLLLGVTLSYHSSLGLQVVIEDYVHGNLSKVVILILNKFFHVGVAMATAFAVLKIALGGNG